MQFTFFQKPLALILVGLLSTQAMALSSDYDVSSNVPDSTIVIDSSSINIPETQQNTESTQEVANDNDAASLNGSVLAEGDNLSIITNNAVSFADAVNDDISVTDTFATPILNADNEEVGCSVALFSDGISCGYINYDYSSEDYISEFSIDTDVSSPYDYLSDEVSATTDNVLYQTNELNYAVTYSDDHNATYYYDSSAGMLDENEFDTLTSDEDDDDGDEVFNASKPSTDVEDKDDDSSTSGTTGKKAYTHVGSVFKSHNNSKLSLGKRTWLAKYDKDISLPSQNLLLTHTGKYACAPAALTAVAAQEGLLYDNKISSTFNKIWASTQTYVDYTEPYTLPNNTKITAQFGATLNKYLRSGMEKYISTYTSKTCSTVRKTNTTYKYITNSIDKNISSTLSYWVYLKDGSLSGHTINVVGYCNATYNNVSAPYIIVGDGWNRNAARYLNFNTSFSKYFIVRYMFN